MNLHSCGISDEVIALQLDISKKQVISILKKATGVTKRNEKSIKGVSDSSSISMFYLDAAVNVDKSIKDARTRLWKSLKWEPRFDLPLEQTQ